MPLRRFPYTALTDHLQNLRVERPYLDVFLSESEIFPEDSIKLLVDSGAEDILIDSQVAELLNIDLEDARNVSVRGLGDYEEPGLAKNVKLQIEGFKPIEVEAIFVDGLGTTGILGQQEFFKNFRIGFNKTKNYFYLENIPFLEWINWY